MNKKAETWKTRFEKAELAQKRLFDRTSKYYDIMYAVQNTTDMAPWRAKVFIPILASKAWDLIARLSGVVPYFQTKVNDIELDENGELKVPDAVKSQQRRLDAKLRKDYLDADEPIKLKVSDTLIDAVVAGTGWAKVSWELKTKEVYSKQIDEENGMVVNPGQDFKDTKEYGCNEFEPTNFFNVFVSPNSPSWAKANYIIVRYFKPFHELKENGNYDLDKLYDKPVTTDFDVNNNARNRIVNEQTFIQEDETVPTATIYECYERRGNKIFLTTYAAGTGNGTDWVKIRNESNSYWHKYYPIVPFYIRKKSFSVFGESLFENNATLQSATNDLFNHYLDNLNVSLDSMIMYEDGTLTSDFVVQPGGEITFTGDKPEQFKFPEPNPAQITSVMNTLEKAIEMATVPQYISGVPDSSTDKTAGTAKGISLITEAATEKIGFMKDNVKQSMTIVGRIMFSNLAQFMDQTDNVEYEEEGQMKSDIVVPGDYQGDISITIDDDSMLPLTKDERRDMSLQWLAQTGQVQKLAQEQSAYMRANGAQPTPVPVIKYGTYLDDLAQYFAVKDTSRYIETVTTPQLPLLGTNTTGEGGEPAPPPGQDPVQAAIQGNQGAAAGGLNAQ